MHVHLGLSSRPELISVEEGRSRGGSRQREGGSKLEGRRVRSGWLATCPDDISRFVCVWLCVFLCEWGVREWGSVCERKIGWVCAWAGEV